MIRAKVSIKDDSREWEKMAKAVRELSSGGGSAVDVGLFGEQGSDLVEYASKNEFGDPNNIFGGRRAPIPERSFIRGAFDERKEEIQRQISKAKLNVVLGRVSKDIFLKRVGLFLQKGIVDRINRSPEWAAPNAPVTIQMKGSSHPLINTGRMRQSITYRIVKL